jgi:hypothetical protein
MMALGTKPGFTTHLGNSPQIKFIDLALLDAGHRQPAKEWNQIVLEHVDVIPSALTILGSGQLIPQRFQFLRGQPSKSSGSINFFTGIAFMDSVMQLNGSGTGFSHLITGSGTGEP